MPTEASLVLVVDDDRTDRMMLVRGLENQGYVVESADSGVKALRLLRTPGRRFDLVLLDVIMPEMDGYDVLRYMKADPSLSRLPVIMVSGIDDISSVVRCLELGADDYLSKPFDPVLLRARINSSLAKKRLHDVEQVYLYRLEEEEAKSDQLLLNILPEAIAARLKDRADIIADSFPDVTVVFADLVGFTRLTTTMGANELVTLLNELFCGFDELASRHHLEKIKTIGDAYLVVGGLLSDRPGHTAEAAQMALDMASLLTNRAGDQLTLRTGIHVGPVVAGVIGKHKFSYDLWGDTVNIASRMESQGVAGHIQVTEDVHARIATAFQFEERGKIEVRGIGEMKTYFLVGN